MYGDKMHFEGTIPKRLAEALVEVEHSSEEVNEKLGDVIRDTLMYGFFRTYGRHIVGAKSFDKCNKKEAIETARKISQCYASMADFLEENILPEEAEKELDEGYRLAFKQYEFEIYGPLAKFDEFYKEFGMVEIDVTKDDKDEEDI